VAKYLWLVLSDATEGREAAFNQWYNEKHLPELLEMPEITAARRYRLAQEQMPGMSESANRYLAVYEVEAESPEAFLEAVVARQSGLSPGPDLDRSAMKVWLFEPLRARP
jgi:hypothetical protein